MKYYLAIDIGASSGRHNVGWCEDGQLADTEYLVRECPPDLEGDSKTLRTDSPISENQMAGETSDGFFQYWRSRAYKRKRTISTYQ